MGPKIIFVSLTDSLHLQKGYKLFVTFFQKRRITSVTNKGVVMRNSLYFGEEIEGFDEKVFNEREIRGAAGLLFVGGMISFFLALNLGQYQSLKVFITYFLIDFIIRLFINPKFAPSIIVSRFIVHKQKPEYVGAPQKKWAWGIGLIMSLVMFNIVVIMDIKGIFNLVMCMTCLTFMFFESAYGVCFGCKLYNIFSRKQARYCPGGMCELKQ